MCIFPVANVSTTVQAMANPIPSLASHSSLPSIRHIQPGAPQPPLSLDLLLPPVLLLQFFPPPCLCIFGHPGRQWVLPSPSPPFYPGHTIHRPYNCKGGDSNRGGGFGPGQRVGLECPPTTAFQFRFQFVSPSHFANNPCVRWRNGQSVMGASSDIYRQRR